MHFHLQKDLVGVTPVTPVQGRIQDFFRRGCTRLFLYFNTNKPHSFFLFLQNTSCIRKPRVISGRGVRTPCTLPLDPPLPWESKAVFDSGLQVLDSNLCQWHLDSGFQSLVGYRILELYSRFQSLGIRDSTSRNFPDSRIRILLIEGVHCGPQIPQKQQKQLTEINITLDYESELVTNNGGIYSLFQGFSLRERRKLKKSAPEKTSRCVWRKDKKFLSFFLSPSRPLLFSFALYFRLMHGNPDSGIQEIFARGIWNPGPWNPKHS